MGEGIREREANTRRGSGRGTVDSEVASDTRGPGFEYSHRQFLLNKYLLLTVCRRDENKLEKRPGKAHFKKLIDTDNTTECVRESMRESKRERTRETTRNEESRFLVQFFSGLCLHLDPQTFKTILYHRELRRTSKANLTAFKVNI